MLAVGFERMAAGGSAQRLNQHPVEPEVTARAELLDPDLHALVPLGGLSDVGAEQPVPPRQVEAVVRVGLARVTGMVDSCSWATPRWTALSGIWASIWKMR